MKTKQHFALALTAGFLTGSLHGIIDIFARMYVWSFEWFELYQTLLLSVLFFPILFFFVFLGMETLLRIFKPNFNSTRYVSFYAVTSIAVLVAFYVLTILNRDILVKSSFFSFSSLLSNVVVFFPLTAIYLYFVLNGHKKTLKTIRKLRTKPMKLFVNNFIFFIVVFLGISVALDLYLFTSIPPNKATIQNSPNVILISLDATRADRLGLYGYERGTSPNLDAFSKNAVVFENAIVPAGWTILSHASLFTGMHTSSRDSERTNAGMRPEEITIFEKLRNRGYHTAGFAAGAWIKGKFGFAQGFDYYSDRLGFIEHGLSYDKFSVKGVIMTFFPFFADHLPPTIVDIDRYRSLEETSSIVIPWTQQNHEKPFFLFLHYLAAHDPYDAKQKFKSVYTDDTREYRDLLEAYRESTGTTRYGEVSEDVLSEMNNFYDALVLNTDYELGKFIDTLEDLNLLENTLIIITADHGEEFYEHGYFTHGKTVYQESVQVPLIVHYPKEFEPKRVERSVSTIDIYATILDFLDFPIEEDSDSVSLVPLLSGSGAYEREFVISELYGLPNHKTRYQTALIKDDWKLIEVEPKDTLIPPGLFNLRTDPGEQRNLYDINVKKRDELRADLLDFYLESDYLEEGTFED